MKTLIHAIVILGLVLPARAFADDVIPSVSREEMSAYKSAFGQAIAESRRPEQQPEKANSKHDSSKANFGSKVSEAAQKGEFKDNKNFGSWVSKQRNRRPDELDGRGAGRRDSSEAKNSSRGRDRERDREKNRDRDKNKGKKN